MYTIHLALGTVTLDADGSVVSPCQSVDEPAFVAYQAWLDVGNQPTIDDTQPVIVPQTVTAAQIRQALNQLGIRAAVDVYVSTASQDLQDLWNYSPTFDVTNQLLITAAKALGADISALFTLAATF